MKIISPDRVSRTERSGRYGSIIDRDDRDERESRSRRRDSDYKRSSDDRRGSHEDPNQSLPEHSELTVTVSLMPFIPSILSPASIHAGVLVF